MALWDHIRNEFEHSDRPAFLRGGFGPPPSVNDNLRCVSGEDRADELDCLRRVLAPELLRAAEARAKELNIGADQVLILWGVIDEEAYLRRLAFHTGIAIENFSEVGRGDSSLRDRPNPPGRGIRPDTSAAVRSPSDLDAGTAALGGTHAMPACRKIS